MTSPRSGSRRKIAASPSVNNHHRDVAIIGGGAVGLAVAWRLTRTDRSVTVIDRGRDDRRTSNAAAGILPPMAIEGVDDPLDRLRGHSHAAFPRWAEEIRTSTGIDVTLRRTGGYYLADTIGELAVMVSMADEWSRTGVDVERLDADELRRRCPSLAGPALDAVRAAWWVPDEYAIDPREYRRGLAAVLAGSGGNLIEAEVTDVRRVDDRWDLDLTTGTVTAGTIVLAGGVSIGSLSAFKSLHRSVIPVRGQILHLDAGRHAPSSVVNVGQRYVVPRVDGTVIVGSVEQEVGENWSTEPDTVAGLRAFAAGLVPELSDAPEIESWSGLRPMTFDGLPMIGPLPGHEDVWVAGGHHRSGIHLSTGTAECLAAAINGDRPPMDLRPFALTGRTLSDRG